MKFKWPSSIELKRNLTWPILLFAALTFAARFPARDGEDIMNARENLHSANPITYWGGFSSLIYGNFPNFLLNWQTILVLIQLTLCALGLYLFFKNSFISSKLVLALSLLLIYTSLVFASQTTRDGTMFSLLVIGFAILRNFQITSFFTLRYLGAVLIIIIAYSFRPWVAVSALPLIYLWAGNKTKLQNLSLLKIISVSLLIMTLPLAFDKFAAISLGLKNSFPEQQVFVTDFASTFCYSNNNNSANLAKTALEKFSSQNDFDQKVCNYFRLDNYHSLIQLDSNVLSAKPFQSDFSLLGPGEEKDFQSIRSIWFKMILNDPITYLQNKTAMALKFAFASDMRGIRFLQEKDMLRKIQMSYFAFYDLILSFHLISILAFVLIVIIQAKLYSRKIQISGVLFQRNQFLVLTSVILWLITSSIAYIGSNGRYSYSIVLLGLIILITQSDEKVTRIQ